MGAAKPVRRIDPKYRPVDGVGDWTELRNRNPDRCYVGALQSNKGMFDVEYYLSMAEGLDMEPEDGWIVETHKKDGVRFRTGNVTRGEGEVIMFRGHVLMSCPKEFKALIDSIGIDGQSGQKEADIVRDQIEGRKGAFEDPKLNVRSRDGATYVRQLSDQEMENR